MGAEFKARRLLFSFWRGAGEHVIFGIGSTAAHRSTTCQVCGRISHQDKDKDSTLFGGQRNREAEPVTALGDSEGRTSYDSKPAASVPTSCYSDMGEEWGSRSENIAIP